MQIQCEQFVYSKFSGASRSAPYKTIAKSPEVTESIMIETRKAFNGCRPISTALSSYATSYAVAPINDGKLALLRLDAIKDIESKNSYILYEHYLIINKIWFREKLLKPWELLQHIPGPEQILKEQILQGSVNIPVQNFLPKIANVFKSLSKSADIYQKSLFTSLFYLLNSQRTLISFRNKPDELWSWVVFLETITPLSIELNLRFFMGLAVPKDWQPNLTITTNYFQLNKDLDINILSDSGQILALDQTKTGYTNFVWRCFACQNENLFSDLLVFAEETASISGDNVSYDIVLKNVIPGNIRLELARLEFRADNVSTDDLYWLWQNSDLTLVDIQFFLPVLLTETPNKWSSNDFAILSKYVNHLFPNEIMACIINSNVATLTLETLLRRWMQMSSNFLENEKLLIVGVLTYLAKKEPGRAFPMLVDLLPKLELNDYKAIKGVLMAFPNDSNIPKSYFWQLLTWLFNSVKKEDDIKLCLDILLSLNFIDEMSISRKYLEYLITHSKDEEGILETNKKLVLASDQARKLSDFIPAMLNVSLISSFPDTLLMLALALKNVKLLSIHKFDNDLLPKSALKILSSKDEKNISAYIFILSGLGYKKRAKDTLCNILMDDLYLFQSIASFTQENFPVRPEDFSIFSDVLGTLEKAEQLRLLIIYCVSTPKIGELQQKLPRINNLLLRVDSISRIEENILEEFLLYLIKNKEWSTACKILEHQIRFEITLKNAKMVREKLKKLFEIISRENKLDISTKIRCTMVVNYVKALPRSAQQEFARWLLVLPLSDPPPVRKVRSQFFVAELLPDYEEWMKRNPFIRYYLFEEISRWR